MPNAKDEFVGSYAVSTVSTAFYGESSGSRADYFQDEATASGIAVEAQALGSSGGLLGVTTGGSATYPLYLASFPGEIGYVDASGALYLENGVHTFAPTRDGHGVESSCARPGRGSFARRQGRYPHIRAIGPEQRKARKSFVKNRNKKERRISATLFS